MKLQGILPALTTPFHAARPCGERLRENIARYQRTGLAGYLVLGSTSEAVLLDEPERLKLLRAARAAIPADRTMVAGVSAESTSGALRQAAAAADCGADVVLVLTPHYYRSQMTDEALLAHFRAVADESALPLLLYNVPKFTGVVLSIDAVAALSRHGNIAGIKESSGDLEYLIEILQRAEPGFHVLCGAAGIVHAALSADATGAVLAAAAAFPEPFLRIAQCLDRGDPGAAATTQKGILEASALVAGTHGVPGIKAAMDLRGLHGGDPRPPLQPVSGAARSEIERVLSGLVADRRLPRLEL